MFSREKTLIYFYIRERSKLRLPLGRLLEPCRYTQGEYDWACEGHAGGMGGTPIYIHVVMLKYLKGSVNYFGDTLRTS